MIHSFTILLHSYFLHATSTQYTVFKAGKEDESLKLIKNLALCMMIAPLLLLPVVRNAYHAAADGAADKTPASFTQSAGETAPSSSLFPSLEPGDVSVLSVTTQEGKFEFLCTDVHTVSLNGRKADEEIFATLLSQIAELPVHTLAPFTPAAEPVMTLSIRLRDGAQHTARFYGDGASGRKARIAATSRSASTYHITDAWRMGTLLLTCEGTRIQDENGREAPVD